MVFLFKSVIVYCNYLAWLISTRFGLLKKVLVTVQIALKFVRSKNELNSGSFFSEKQGLSLRAMLGDKLLYFTENSQQIVWKNE